MISVVWLVLLSGIIWNVIILIWIYFYYEEVEERFNKTPEERILDE